MPEPEQDSRRREEEIGEEIGRKFGLGMFGLVGWSVAVPTVLGIALGLWLDAKLDSAISWTLTMLFVGVVLGCLNAWYWVKRESRHN
jgi:ATP synthase protein I